MARRAPLDSFKNTRSICPRSYLSLVVGSDGRGGSMPSEKERLVWRKACSSGACVEVAVSSSLVYLRSSRDPAGPWLAFEPAVWQAFFDQVKAGEFDLPAE